MHILFAISATSARMNVSSSTHPHQLQFAFCPMTHAHSSVVHDNSEQVEEGQVVASQS